MRKMAGTRRRLLTCAILSILTHHLQAPSQTTINTRLPSTTAGVEGLAVSITVPTATRYADGAPVVVYVPGGWGGDGISYNQTILASHGFLEIRFNFPGSGVAPLRSGGVYDNRGFGCIAAVRDVLRFASGLLPDSSGRALYQLVDPVVPRPDNVGAVGSSNGGNATITAAGAYGDLVAAYRWIVNWESPVGDAMPTVEAGAVAGTPPTNPAYDTASGTFDTRLLAYSDTLTVSRPPNPILRGGFYYDINQNGVLEQPADYILRPLRDSSAYGIRMFYSVLVARAAEELGLYPSSAPAHLPDSAETSAFWYWREAEKWIAGAVAKRPELMFIAVASRIDHVQGAPDHPHVLTQYLGMLNAGARFVRLNPDRSYAEHVSGGVMPLASDNDGFLAFGHAGIGYGLEPEEAEGGPSASVAIAAAACELADRTASGDLSPQLSDLVTIAGHRQGQSPVRRLTQSTETGVEHTVDILGRSQVDSRLSRSGSTGVRITRSSGIYVVFMRNGTGPR